MKRETESNHQLTFKYLILIYVLFVCHFQTFYLFSWDLGNDKFLHVHTQSQRSLNHLEKPERYFV